MFKKEITENKDNNVIFRIKDIDAKKVNIYFLKLINM